MKHKVKLAVIPLFASVVMVLSIGGYFAFAETDLTVSQNTPVVPSEEPVPTTIPQGNSGADITVSQNDPDPTTQPTSQPTQSPQTGGNSTGGTNRNSTPEPCS